MSTQAFSGVSFAKVEPRYSTDHTNQIGQLPFQSARSVNHEPTVPQETSCRAFEAQKIKAVGKAGGKAFADSRTRVGLEVADMIAPHRDEIQGLTVVTHGFQLSADSGDSLQPLATAVRNRADAENGSDSSAWLLDYDVRGDGFSGGFDLDLNESDDGSNNGSITWGSPSEIVMLFDWAPESNEISTGWGEAAGDALFTLLTSLDLLRLAPGRSNPSFHFIAHSFGTAVTTEAIERMAFYEVPVDQVTLLDPHDFDESGIPVDGDHTYLTSVSHNRHRMDSHFPKATAATVWDNVAFADVYYQTRPIPLVPEGRPIPGAYNQLMNNQTDVADSLLPHSSIWEDFYVGTILDSTQSADNGYAFSRVASGVDPRPSADRTTAPQNFYSSGQDHQHTATELLPSNITSLAERQEIANSKQQPDWSWSTAVVNGAFTHPGDEFDSLSLVSGDNLIPGWSHHGGSGSGRVREQNGNYYLELSSSGPSRTHNTFYVDPQAAILEFDLRVESASPDDLLVVSIDQTEIGQVSLAAATTTFATQRLVVPQSLRGASRTLTFRVQPPINAAIEAEVHIDNVMLTAGGRTGDIVPVDLASLVPSGSDFAVVGWDVMPAGGAGAPQAVGVLRNVLRGDHHLTLAGETIAYVIFSDRTSGGSSGGSEAFASSGRLYFAPPIAALGASLDNDAEAYGFQGQFRLWFKEGEDLASVPAADVASLIGTLSGSGSDSAKIAAINSSTR